MLQVWFKHDLRLDDHPGLHSAVATGSALVPVYCFDPSQLLHLLRASHGLEGDPAIATYTMHMPVYLYIYYGDHPKHMPSIAMCQHMPACHFTGTAMHNSNMCVRSPIVRMLCMLCFTPVACCAITGLLGAVKALKQGLQQLGSDLVILWGPPEQQLPSLADQIQASSLILEEEIEYR